MKRLLPKLTVLLLVLIAAICAFAACTKPTVTEISVHTKPQTVYVLGHELNLSGGMLTVVDGDNTEQIPLDSDGVSVSGYDKDKLGSQELTIEYKGKTTQLTVNVVPRMIAENADTDYFVGEKLNRNKGRIRITRDDGTNFTVDLNSAALTLGSFNSSAVGEVTVTAHYGSGSESYDGTISLKVHNVDSVEPTRPSKLSYGSHEGAIDLKGGYLTVKGDGISKHVELTEDMIEGFDLSVVSIDHRTEQQTVTVRYLGRTFPFSITITFSNVSLIQQRIAELAELDWTGTAPPEYTHEQGEAALEAISLYMNLSNADKAYIEVSDLDNIARLASVHGLTEWKAAVAEYPGLFTIENSLVYFTPTTYEGAKQEYAKLQNADQPIFTLAAKLDSIQKQFPDIKIIGEVTIAYYLSLRYTSDTIKGVVPMLQYMISLYEALADIPDDVTLTDLPKYSAQIGRAHSYLANSRYKDLSDRYIYDYVSSWRTEDDYFDIIYAYYCFNSESVEIARTTINMIKDIHLYGDLEKLFMTISDTIAQLNSIRNGYENDTTQFLYLYNSSLKLASELSQSDDVMIKELFPFLTFNNLISVNGSPVSVSFYQILDYIRTDTPGYLYFNYGMLGDEEFTRLLNEYVRIFTDVRLIDGYFQSETYEADIAQLFKHFVETSPSRQYNFIMSINAYYNWDSFPGLALDYSQTFYSYFTALIANHYDGVLPESAKPIFAKLLLALEYTTQRTEAGLKEFDAIMKEVESAYGELNTADKATFNEHADFLYEKYIELYKSLQQTEEPDLGDYEEKFAELEQTIGYLFMMEEYVSQGLPTYSFIFAAYEKAQAIADDLIATAPDDIVYIYYNQTYPIYKFNCTMEMALYYARSVYISHLTSLSVRLDGEYLIYDLYSQSHLQGFMADAFYVMFGNLFTDSTNPDAESQFKEPDKVVQAMKSFRELSSFDKALFLALDGDMDIYRGGLRQFFKENFSTEGYTVATRFLDLEDVYVDYANHPEGSYELVDGSTRTFREDFEEAMQRLTAAYGQLEGDDLDAFDSYLLEAYNYYLEIYENLD